jgi:adenylate kinase family enzyme
VIFGNSGSGKSTLAKELCEAEGYAHLDLDSLAWTPASPPVRMPLDESKHEIDAFVASHQSWVVEGCYSDLIEIVLPVSTEVIFLNLPVEDCIANAKSRPWEPQKYDSKVGQDENLGMLIDWIAQYADRNDTFSRSSHEALFREFPGKKTMYVSNDRRR